MMRWFESPTFFNAMVSGLRIVHRFVVQKAYPTLILFCAQNRRNLEIIIKESKGFYIIIFIDVVHNNFLMEKLKFNINALRNAI